ncbi:hypothetical protein ACFOZY_08225 [Chungangia koreensis]|uniref:Permuted papain-like amidase enzyme, YaeF/YiiX, C92 family n=1 Tax=Chungangia koreensis TaxID=752657 RepID=A0ABV8X395_9LACT
MLEREIFIVLTDTGTLLTRMIRLYTKLPLNHVSIAFDDSLTEVYSFGRKRPHNPFIGGFVREDFSSFFFQHSACGIYRCKVSAEDYDRMLKRIRNIEEQKHKYRYNFIGLFGVMFNREIKRERAFFCSQFVATILNECEEEIVRCSPYLIQPQHFMVSEQLELVYAGDLANYPKLGRGIQQLKLRVE